MRQRKFFSISIGLLVLVVILACRTAELVAPPPAATQEPSQTPTPRTARAVPSDTAVPSATLTTTPTSTPKPATRRPTTAAPTPTVTPSPSGPDCSRPPTIEFFRAEPMEIGFGQSAKLSWGKVENAKQVVIGPGIGGVGTPGSKTVSPTQTTTYVMTATGCGGTVTKQVTITVTGAPPPGASPTNGPPGATPTTGSPPPTPSCSNPPAIDYFAAQPEGIAAGQSSMLMWAISNAQQADITGVGNVNAASGFTVVSPTQTTTYTLTAVGCGRTTTKQTTVTVTNAPPPTPVGPPPTAIK